MYTDTVVVRKTQLLQETFSGSNAIVSVCVHGHCWIYVLIIIGTKCSLMVSGCPGLPCLVQDVK